MYGRLQNVLLPHVLLPNVLAGLTAGLVTIVYSISFAALVFSDSLTPFFPQGVVIALVGATVSAIVVAWRSAFPFAVAGIESNSVVILALMAGAIGQTLESQAPERTYPTVWAALLLSTSLTGLFLFIVGRLRLGAWARFIPYPVIGGFLAGTGWLITRSSFKVMVGFPLELSRLSELMQPNTVLHWLIGVLFSLLLFFALTRYQHFAVLPGLLVIAIISFDIAWWLINASPVGSSAAWFFQPLPSNQLLQTWQFSQLARVDWSVLVHQSGTLAALMTIVVISILLNSTGLELAASKNVDLNRELQINGIANMVNGLCGGMVGYLSINRSLLNRQAGATNPLAGIIAGGLCSAVLFSGAAFLAYLPKSILGGLLLYIGLSLLLRWVYRAWFQFSRLDYALIILILVIIAVWGFLQGVGAGIAVACFLFIFNYGRTPVVKHVLSGSIHQSNVQRSLTEQKLLQQKGDCIYILVLQGFIFFGTANALLERVHQRLDNPSLNLLLFVVFDFRLVSGIDSSAVLSLIKLKQLAQKRHLSLLFTHLHPTLQQQLEQGDLFVPDDEVCRLFPDLDLGLEWCESQILEASYLRRRRVVPLALQLKSLFPVPDLSTQLMSYLERIHLEAGDYLFHQGEPFDGLYFLESGRLSVLLELPDGQTKRLRSFTGMTTIGEIGLYQQAPRSASVIADQSSSLYFLSVRAFEAIETENPKLAASFHKFIVDLLVERLLHSEQELKSLLT